MIYGNDRFILWHLYKWHRIYNILESLFKYIAVPSRYCLPAQISQLWTFMVFSLWKNLIYLGRTIYYCKLQYLNVASKGTRTVLQKANLYISLGVIMTAKSFVYTVQFKLFTSFRMNLTNLFIIIITIIFQRTIYRRSKKKIGCEAHFRHTFYAKTKKNLFWRSKLTSEHLKSKNRKHVHIFMVCTECGISSDKVLYVSCSNYFFAVRNLRD